MEYELIRSNRKTIGLEIRNGRLLVRAPFLMPCFAIEKELEKHRAWIQTHLAKETAAPQEEALMLPKLTEEERKDLRKKAAVLFPERAAFYASLLSVSYGKISCRFQKTRWGSCTAKGDLNFNCLLLLTPPEVLDAVVVHELCHRKEMNHSAKFYKEVLSVYPDYPKWNGWLKKNGKFLMNRIR